MRKIDDIEIRICKLYRRLTGRAEFPRIVRIRAFIPSGCKFEVTTQAEALRIEAYGGEEEFTHLIVDELKSGEVLYDIGACVGLITIHAVRKKCRVVAFEPDPNFRSRLERNILLNGISNVQIIDKAVSDSIGEAVLYTDGVEGNSPSLCEFGERGRVVVHTVAIDCLLKNSDIPFPDIVKVDIEGAEMLALKGMQKLLASDKRPRVIFIEIHPEFLSAFGSSCESVKSYISSFGYEEVYSKGRKNQIHCIFRK